MLDCSPPKAHGTAVPVEPALHGVEHSFVFPTRNASVVARRAPCLDRALRTCAAPVAPHLQPIFFPREPVDRTLASRALILIVSSNVDEVRLVEPTLCFGVGGRRLGQNRCDAGVMARLDLHTVVVAAIGDRSEEHTSELQSRQYLVCRLLLEKK